MENKGIKRDRPEDLTPDEKYIYLAIKEQFYLQQENSVRLSFSAIYQLILKLHHRVNVLDIIEFLDKRWRLTSEPVHFRYRMSYLHDDYIQDKDRCYIFNAEEFLTVQELQDFHQMMKGTEEFFDDSSIF
ncbi:MAG: hypothetical protein UHK44_07650 [Bacteroidaceae bacterium]|nr:hypothetical protein [Bacteroidaceae bacterium]